MQIFKRLARRMAKLAVGAARLLSSWWPKGIRAARAHAKRVRTDPKYRERVNAIFARLGAIPGRIGAAFRGVSLLHGFVVAVLG